VSEVLPPSGRRGRRAERRRQQRRRRNQVLAVLLALALAAAVVAVTTMVRGDEPPPAAVDAQGRTQTTLLFQVRGEDGAALASALLAHDPASGNGTVVLVPRQVIADAAGAGASPFAQILATGSEESSRNALADLLGITVDDGWVLDAGTLAALVDALGGLSIVVDVPVMEGPTVVLTVGQQQLSGAQVVTFVSYLRPDEQEQTRLARLQDVFDALLAALPDDTGEVQALLGQLGDGSRSTLPAGELAERLVGLAEATEADAVQYDTLPVIPLDAGGGESAFRLDEPAAQALVERRLAQSVPEGERATGNRVLVLNGVGTPGIGEAVRGRLIDEGFVFVGSRNAPRFDYANTVVLVPEATPEAQLLGERVAAALGVQADVRTDQFGTIADVVVIIGADFSP
jgi:anionic cell wall polymer biosynthesis LytR-Cps2A-Psr (LCP) family protein